METVALPTTLWNWSIEKVILLIACLPTLLVGTVQRTLRQIAASCQVDTSLHSPASSVETPLRPCEAGVIGYSALDVLDGHIISRQGMEFGQALE